MEDTKHSGNVATEIESQLTGLNGGTQADADRLRARAREIERQSMCVSGEAGNTLSAQARALRKQAQGIEEWLPS